jgi:hypothetical protein
MKRLIIFGLMLAMLPIVFASQRNVDINDAAFTGNLGNVHTGNYFIGSLIFTPSITNFSTFDILPDNSTGAYPDVSIHTGDYIRLSPNASNSIILGGVVMQPGNSQQMNSVGIFNYFEAVNTTKTGRILVDGLPYPEVKISTDTDKPYKLVFDSTDVIVDGEKVVQVNFTSPFDLKAQAYVIPVWIEVNGVTQELNYTVNVASYQDFAISSYSCLNQISMGASDILCRVEVQNLGNDYINLNINTGADIAPFVYMPKDFTLFPAYSQELAILYSIDKVGVATNYTSWVDITGGNITQRINVSFSIVDSIKPSIDYNSLDTNNTFEAGDPVQFVIKASDNFNISNVEGIVRYQDQEPAALDKMMTKRNAEYFLDFNTTQIGSYTFEVRANDSSGNINSTKESFTIVARNCVKFPMAVYFGRVKFNSWSDNVVLLNITKPTDITIALNAVAYSGNWQIKVTDTSTGKQTIFRNDSRSEATFSVADAPSQITIAFIGDTVGQYNGDINITLPPYALTVPYLTFTGAVITYDIPKPFTDDFFGSQLKCTAVDTGTYETSYYDCGMRLPIGVNIQEVAIPITPTQKQTLVDKMLLDTQNAQKRAAWYLAISIGVSLALLITIGIAYWLIVQQPYIRMKTR